MNYEVYIDNKNYKKTIKKLKKIIKICDSNNYKLIVKYDKAIKKEYKEEFDKIQKAINIKNIEKRYSYIYDSVCNYLDSKYFGENLCGFDENGVCEYYRKEDPSHYNGCCYREDRSLCKYFDEEHSVCTERGISCKLYSCPILREKGIKYRIKDIPLINSFFSIKQKFYIKYSFLKPKPYVMYKLMECVNEKNRK